MTTTKKPDDKPATKKPPNPTRLLLYIGRRLWLKGGKPGHVYLAIKDEDSIPHARVPSDTELMVSDAAPAWSKPLGKWTRPGQVVRVEHLPSNDGSVYRDTAKVVGSLPREACAELQATHHAIEAALTRDREAEKDGKRDIPMEVLEPLARAYKRLRTKPERAVFLGRVIDTITRGSGL